MLAMQYFGNHLDGFAREHLMKHRRIRPPFIAVVSRGRKFDPEISKCQFLRPLMQRFGVNQDSVHVEDQSLGRLEGNRHRSLDVVVVAPLQKFPKSCPAMAIACFLFRSQFGKSLPNRWEVKKRIVPEPIRSAWRVQDYSLGDAAKCRKRLAVAGCRQYAHKTPGTLLRWDALQLFQYSSIVFVVVGIGIGQVRLLRRIPSRVDSGSAVQGIYFQT